MESSPTYRSPASGSHGSRGGVLKIAFFYAGFSALWIALSDKLLGLVLNDPATIIRVSTLKGWAFVFLTSLLIYSLTRRLVDEIRLAQQREQETLADKLRNLNLLDALVEGSSDAIFVKDAEGRYVLVNRAACDFVGKPAAEVLGRNDLDIFAPTDAATNMAADRRVIAADGPVTYEVEVNTPRRQVNLLTTKGPIHDVYGKVVGLFGIARDITERKAAQATLRRQAQMLKESQRIARVGSWAIDFAADRITWSEETYRIFGVAPDAFDHTFGAYLALIHPDDRTAAQAWAEALRTGEAPAELEFRILRAEGGEIIVNALGAPVRESRGDNNAARAIGTVQDITDRKSAISAALESEARYRTLFEDNPYPMWLYDPETLAFLAVNDAAIAQYGYSRDEFLRMTVKDIRPPEEVPKLLARVAHAARGINKSGLWRHCRKDGSEILVEVTSHTLTFGGRCALAVLAHDVTDRERSRAEMELTAKVFEQGSEGIIICDADRKIITVNRALCKATGYSLEELIGSNPNILSSGRHDKEFFRNLWAQVESQGHWQGEVWNRRKSGEIYPERLSISTIRDAEGQITHYVGIASDISEHKVAEAHILHLANFDALTGLPNRSLLNDRIEQAISLAQRGRQTLALLFLDIDRFKNVNNSLGHQVGDQMLVEIAGRLKSEVRGEDTVSRLGGDEFILLLPNTDTDGAAHAADKIIRGMAAPFLIGATELSITPSIGIAMYPDDGHSIETLLQSADAALYRAKQGGRSTFRFFTAEMHRLSSRSLLLENALRRALERDQLGLVYQPQMDIRSGCIVGCEALLRWQHPELGIVSPAEFIPIAEDTGLIVPIGEWVLRTAARQNQNWLQAGLPPLVMAVNISAVQFHHTALPDLLSQVLLDTGLAPEYLELELTESITMKDPEMAIGIIERLNQQGIKLAIDDFGTGYSSLAYLKRLNVAKLKIDQSFIRDIAVDADSEAIVSAVINLATSLELQTIAEGVETEQQLAFLRDKGCQQMQGYHLSKPLPAKAFEDFVRRWLALSATECGCECEG